MRFLFFDKLNASEYAIARVRKWQCRRKPEADPSATRRLPNSRAHRTAPRANARPRGKARRERTPTNPPRSHNITWRKRAFTKPRATPLSLRAMPWLSRTPWSSRAAAWANASQNKEGPPPYKRGAFVTFMKKTASRCARSRRCPQSPNRAYRPCRSNRNGWHNSTLALHRPNTSQPGRQQ